MRSINVGNDSCSITLCGDTSLGDFYMRWNGDAIYQRLCQAPTSFVEGLKSLVSESDIFIANLETCFANERRSPFRNSKRNLGWDDPERTLSILKELGVTAVNLANNHSMDFGSEILLQGIGLLRNAGFEVFGAGANQKASSEPLIQRLQFGERSKALYVLGAYEIKRRYRDAYQYYATPSSPGINPLHPPSLRAQIERLRKGDPDAVIIVCPHWYLNYRWGNEWQFDLCRSLVSAGADLVIGHGLHMLGQCLWEPSGTQVVSIGNFVFNSLGFYDKFAAPPYSLVARLEITPRPRGWSSALKLYPIISDNRRTGFRPQPIDEATLPIVYALLAEHAPDQPTFNNNFDIAQDERGPHIALKRPISSRFLSDDVV